MAGYVGTKAVLLSTTAATVGGDADIGGDLTVDTSTLHVDSTNNLVGVGTILPSSRLEVQSLNNTLATDIFKFTSLNGAAGLKFGYQRIEQIGASTPITFNTGGSEAMRIDSSGHLIIPAGVTLGTSAGTYAAANTLDDYEEGTWTPVIRGSTGDPTVTDTSGNTGGRYIKIGNMVWISFECRWTGISGGSGNCSISGLPFTRVNTTEPDGDRATFDFYQVTVPSGGINSVVSVAKATTTLGLSFGRSANTTAPLPVANLLNVNPGFIRASLVYDAT